MIRAFLTLTACGLHTMFRWLLRSVPGEPRTEDQEARENRDRLSYSVNLRTGAYRWRKGG